MGIDHRVLNLALKAQEGLKGAFALHEEIAGVNQLKVLKAMQDNRLSESHFGISTGYGYHDSGREVLESIYADVFKTESALARPQIISGTHALSTALFGNLKHGDELACVTGKPYDTLDSVIGIHKARGSLMEHGIIYKQADLEGAEINYGAIAEIITKNTKIAAIQRSKGYAWRHSLSVEEIGDIIGFVKGMNKDAICMVDNCYGEFVELAEPSEAGADLVVGSMIKNPGGGLAPVGGYIAGKEEYVENAAARLGSPGLGKEAGPSLGIAPALLQGLFLSPQVVCGCVKGAMLASEMFLRLGFDVLPLPGEKRTDIVQAVKLGSLKALLSFCEGIQKAAPVDSFAKPEPWNMPGYDSLVVMAAGAFIQGSSIELSADAPIREPYTAYFQGGLTWHHAKAGIIIAIDNMLKDGVISIKS
ncbi:MAG: methionine gamma-lyase family protein [Clostridiales bacterium]|jgi:cystathionine beta-lyase family protein involved in aluminum resistance|nr:methionine gamma-lyase family protein [Clostridiales bacterium]